MQAIILKQPGGVENLEFTELPVPVVGAGEVLIKVKAISINPVDVKTRKGTGIYGRLKELSPIILGWDVSGVVEKTGTGATQFKVGDEVFGMVNFPGQGKAMAEYVVAPEEQLALKPSTVSHAEAAAATLAALTAWQAFVVHYTIKKGDRVLIHGAAGGVGHYAIQMAKNLGAYVIGTSSAPKRNLILALGADEHFDYTQQKFEEVYRDMDLVLDTIGGDNMIRSLETLKKGGTLISIPSGMSPDLVERAKEKGVTGKAMLVVSSGEHMKRIAELLASGELKSHIAREYPIAEVAAAHTELEQGRTAGKIILSW